MALLINKTLTFGEGIQIPMGVVMVPNIHIAASRPYFNTDQPPVLQYSNMLSADCVYWQSKELWKLQKGQVFPNELPGDWYKSMTNEELDQLIDNGIMAEVWIQAEFNSKLKGNYVTIVNIRE